MSSDRGVNHCKEVRNESQIQCISSVFSEGSERLKRKHSVTSSGPHYQSGAEVRRRKHPHCGK